MITHHFNEELQLLEILYQDDVSLDEITIHPQNIIDNNDFPRDLKILVDARTANYTFTFDAIDKFKAICQQAIKNYNSIKVAVIHAKPVESAYSQLVGIEQIDKNYHHKTFTNIDNAFKWLQLN